MADEALVQNPGRVRSVALPLEVTSTRLGRRSPGHEIDCYTEAGESTMEPVQLGLTPMTEADIEAEARAMGVVLPRFYVAILTSVGCGEDEWPPLSEKSIEILRPLEVVARFGPFFDDPSWIGTRYFPFGVDVYRQMMWVIDCSSEQMASIWHELNPEEWAEATWFPRTEWIERNGLSFLHGLA